MPSRGATLLTRLVAIRFPARPKRTNTGAVFPPQRIQHASRAGSRLGIRTARSRFGGQQLTQPRKANMKVSTRKFCLTPDDTLYRMSSALSGRLFSNPANTPWGATIILSGRTTFMMAGGEESKAA